jgi:acetamidase/formamidase
MLRTPIASTAAFFTLVGFLAGQSPTPRTHRLEATPTTVAYGYYWADAKPALRIASGGIIDVDTLLTNTPTGLQRAGVPPEKIQASLKAIVAEVTGDRRGPGGHILTGPVYVEGAQPGDVLEVKILSIISMASDEDLKVATTVAIQEMVDFLAATKNLTKHEAYQLVSVAGNVAMTQLVDRPVYGVHVKMPKDIFK